MTHEEPRPRAPSPVFRAPAALAGLILLGLAAALSGEDAGRWFCWLALGTPLWLCLWYPLRAARALDTQRKAPGGVPPGA